MLGHEWETPEKLSTGKFAVGQWAPVLHQIGDTTWLFYSENSPKCLRPAQINGKDGETPLAHPIPKRWIIGGSIVVRTRVGIEGLWSNTRVVFSQRMELSIPKLIANRLTVLSTGEWILPFWRQRSTHACASLRTHNNAAGEVDVSYNNLPLLFTSTQLFCLFSPQPNRCHDVQLQPLSLKREIYMPCRYLPHINYRKPC